MSDPSGCHRANKDPGNNGYIQCPMINAHTAGRVVITNINVPFLILYIHGGVYFLCGGPLE